MITENDLREAIAECEGQRNPSANTCLKLAAFYTIRDKMYPVKKEDSVVNNNLGQSFYSMSSREFKSDSDFIQAVNNVDPEEFLLVMDELMTTVKAIIPKLYDGVMRKLTK